MISDENISVDFPQDVPCVMFNMECISVFTYTETEVFQELQD